jgi:hypothetical protein
MHDKSMPNPGRALDGDGQAGEADGSSGERLFLVTVPGELVERLREGAFVAIGGGRADDRRGCVLG